MDRIIGIDYGRKRVGIAVSDPLCIFAQPLETVPAAKVMDYLKNYAKEENVKGFVIGMPKNLDNSPSDCAADVKPFLAWLKRQFPQIPVYVEDERFTTVLAQRAMIDGGVKKGERSKKGAADRISAAIILQGFLDRKDRNKK